MLIHDLLHLFSFESNESPNHKYNLIYEGVLFFEIEVSGECKESFTDISGVLSCEAIGEREYRIGASSDIREDLFKHISAQGLALLTLRQVEESMEEMFQRITEGKRKEE